MLAVLDQGWDLLIGHPPCTHLCVSGIHWNDRGRGWSGTKAAVDFVMKLNFAKIKHKAIENPIGILSRVWRKPDQIIQPYQFGHDASKATCLWLENLPPLTIDTAQYFPPRIVDGKKRWGNQTDSGQNKLGPSEKRSAERARTYQGVANAMAEQWGNLKT